MVQASSLLQPAAGFAGNKLGAGLGTQAGRAMGAGQTGSGMLGGASGGALGTVITGGSPLDIGFGAGRGALQQGIAQTAGTGLGTAAGPFLGAVTGAITGQAPSGEGMVSSGFGTGMGMAFGGPIGMAAGLAAGLMLSGQKKAPWLRGSWEGGVQYDAESGRMQALPTAFIAGDDRQPEQFRQVMSRAGQRRSQLVANQLNQYIAGKDLNDTQRHALARYGNKKALELPRMDGVRGWVTGTAGYQNPEAYSQIARGAEGLMKRLDLKDYYSRDRLDRSIASKMGFDPGKENVQLVDWYRTRKGVDEHEAARRNFDRLTSEEILAAAQAERQRFDAAQANQG